MTAHPQQGHCKNEGRCIDFTFAPPEWRENDICHLCGCDGDTRSRQVQQQTDVLDQLEAWCNQRWFEVEDDSEKYSVIHVGDIIAKIAELRSGKQGGKRDE